MAIVHKGLYLALLRVGADHDTASEAAEALGTQERAISQLRNELRLTRTFLAGTFAVALLLSLGLVLTIGP